MISRSAVATISLWYWPSMFGLHGVVLPLLNGSAAGRVVRSGRLSPSTGGTLQLARSRADW